MPGLEHRTVALLESRFSDELATLVCRLGGTPISAPAVGEVPCHNDFGTFIDGLAGRRFSLAIFLTGTGITTLFKEAERRGRLAEALSALKDLTIACRGAKPLAVLKRHGLRAQITTARPHTTQELLSALAAVDVKDRGVLLVHYGERNVPIAHALRARGARLDEVCPYEWALPEDTTPLETALRDTAAGRIDLLLFTSANQVSNVLTVAEQSGQLAKIRAVLENRTQVASIGPTCSEALHENGFPVHFEASPPKMGQLVRGAIEAWIRK